MSSIKQPSWFIRAANWLLSPVAARWVDLLSAMTTSKVVQSLDLEVFGRHWSDYCRVGMDRATQQWARIPAVQIFDLPPTRIAVDPVGAAEDLHPQFGLDFEGARATLTEAAEQRAGSNGNRHRYSLDAFGLDETYLRQNFSDIESLIDSLSHSAIDPA